MNFKQWLVIAIFAAVALVAVFGCAPAEPKAEAVPKIIQQKLTMIVSGTTRFYLVAADGSVCWASISAYAKAKLGDEHICKAIFGWEE